VCCGCSLAVVMLSWVELFAWTVLFFLLLRILSKLQQIHALLHPHAPPPPSLMHIPLNLTHKAYVFLWGCIYLVLSKDKVSKKAIENAADPDEIRDHVDRQVRIIFIRHGESIWNLVFNRGFKPSFLWRLFSTMLYESYLLPLDDSAFMDSPLSALGFQQCAQLQEFLRKPCVDVAARADFETLVSGEGRSVLVTSQLRRAAATIAYALSDRLGRSKEALLLHSSCQEITRNVDSQSLAEPFEAPTLQGTPEFEKPVRLDGQYNRGNKSLGFTGLQRLADFARWASERTEPTIIVAGHSLWFRTFFQLYLPKSEVHVSKKSKMVNCGVVGFTMQTGRTPDGQLRHRIDPSSLAVIYGGFSSK